ncbi:hypothetical protein BBP40_003439 [Aspergillus hancockii]|nr:hypothetical protein BBP40_003439 [Aspergillus hancockii]
MVPPTAIFERNFAVPSFLSVSPTTAQLQAIWLTAYPDGYLRLSQSTEDYELTTEGYVRFTKFRNPGECGGKHRDLVFESLPYWDELLRDVGSNARGLVQEYIQLRNGEKESAAKDSKGWW